MEKPETDAWNSLSQVLEGGIPATALTVALRPPECEDTKSLSLKPQHLWQLVMKGSPSEQIQLANNQCQKTNHLKKSTDTVL